MRVTSLPPSDRLAPFVRTFTIVETDDEATRVLMPAAGLIMGLRWSGSATQLDGTPERMPEASIAGFLTTTRLMRTSAAGCVVLAEFREGGAAQFISPPLHELSGRTFALEDFLGRTSVDEARSRIADATSHRGRVASFEEFLLSRRLDRAVDPIVAAAVDLIRRRRGSLRMRALAEHLSVSADAIEKRFRRVVGTTPKQYASMIRLRHALSLRHAGVSLTAAALEAGYFDQAHFNRDFRRVTGTSPREFFRGGDDC